MKTVRAIRHVDAFTTRPLEGNPAAVVDGDGLSAETMQRIALNQHLSETVFLLPPESDKNHARLRIFTPGTELPFAGHPTIAASHILISESRVRLADGESLRLETGAGVIPVAISGDPPRYTMTQAAPKFRDSALTVDQVAEAAGLDTRAIVRVEDVSTGLSWPLVQLSSIDQMRRLRPNLSALMRIPQGVAYFCIGTESEDHRVHVRAFAPAAGVFEDPVTGSANGCIAALIAKHELLPARDGAITYVAEQGIEMGQPGLVYASVTPAPDIVVRIGGHAVTVLRGDLLLDL